MGPNEPQQNDRPMEGHGSQPQQETDDAYFASERERQDPEADALDDTDDQGPDAAQDLGGGEGDFRQSHRSDERTL